MRQMGVSAGVAICLAVSCVVALRGQGTAAGAASKVELAILYRRYFESRDAQKLDLLVYWPGVAQRERDAFERSVRQDLKFKLKNVAFASIGDTKALEYTLEGTTYRPTLTPVARLVATYEGTAEIKTAATSYLVGVKRKRYFITLASPVPK
ncbi:MAG TPA: hypothetical protein VM716_12125 [Gemmatimonadales bacterium]|nr:hypothetical protein [Gemmatimonadales bacterium]